MEKLLNDFMRFIRPREENVLETVNKIVADRRAKFFSPCTTDAQREALVARDLETTFDGEKGEGLVWPFRRVIDSPFMFLDPTPELQEEIERVQQRGGGIRGKSIAFCAAAQQRYNWIKRFSTCPFVLCACPPGPSGRSAGLQSAEELDRFYEEVSEVFSFRDVWVGNNSLTRFENLPDAVVLRALTYLPVETEDYFVRAVKAGRAELAETLADRVVGTTIEILAQILKMEIRKETTDAFRKLIGEKNRAIDFVARYFELLKPHVGSVDIFINTLLRRTAKDETEIHVNLLYIFQADELNSPALNDLCMEIHCEYVTRLYEKGRYVSLEDVFAAVDSSRASKKRHVD